ncbi:hypothetical protein [Streptantibioticus ferralitis]|uniref:Uncharacterized protein n=1 Tax=Streptantibioticus ferralitis TaxID=236510 RepID=A0ABT5ZCP1_9ACTN|nr:hypothetical protein [Streptantibioticus ferralitis]MDF2261589.1 hypothetical protein [Streptantibioticus ferralitis]
MSRPEQPGRHHRRLRTGLFPAALLSVSLVVGGCTSTSPRAPVTPSIPPSASPAGTPLANTNWASAITDIDCTTQGNEGIEVLGTRFAAVRGADTPDAFVWFDCVHQASSWPHQLDVYDGSSAPDAPRRIATLVSATEQVNGHGLRVAGLSFSGHSVTVDLVAYAPNDPMCCPTQRLQRTFAWQGGRFVQGSG